MLDFLTTGSSNGPVFILVVNIVVLVMGLSMAMASGRAIAKTWRPFSKVLIYALILSAAERFLHFALAGQPLLSVKFYLVSFVLLMLAASFGFRRMRAQQMVTQYSWLYRSVGGLGWSVKS